MRILLAENDTSSRHRLKTILAREGYYVLELMQGQDALQALNEGEFAAMLLDLDLPDMEGLELLKRLRERTAIPIMIITHRRNIDDKVHALDAGADDYLVKPYDKHELLARLRMVIRRSVGRTTRVLTLGPLTIDEARRQVLWQSSEVVLARREFALLLAFANNVGRVLTRPFLEEVLYGCQDEVDSNALEVHIHHLRKKLSPALIDTVRGIGYRMRTMELETAEQQDS